MSMRQQIAQFLYRLARRIDDRPSHVRPTIHIDGKALAASVRRGTA